MQDIQYSKGRKGESYFFTLTVKNKEMVIEVIYWKDANSDDGETSFLTLQQFPAFVDKIKAEGFKIQNQK